MNEKLIYKIDNNGTINSQTMEEETMPNANYVTINKDFGSMPLSGYLNKAINFVKDCDGLEAIEFLKNLNDWATDIEKESDDNNHKEKEFFFSICNPDNTMSLYYDISESLEDVDPYNAYEETKLYRMYINNQDWGLDEVKIKEEEYSLVKVHVTRIREVKEEADVYIAVADSFSDDPESEASHFIENSYYGDPNWETYDDFYNSTECEIEVEETEIEDHGTREEIDGYYDVDEHLK